jgi:undecaprenyl-diphosphatase
VKPTFGPTPVGPTARQREKEGKLGVYLVLATIPAALIGLKFEKVIETSFRQPLLVAISLIFGAMIIYLAEKIGRQKMGGIQEIGVVKSLTIGLAQSLALIPGISRSGITIASGMFLGLTRKDAAEFAFLLSGPIVLGAGGKKFLEFMSVFINGGINFNEASFFIIGIVASAISGWLAIKFLLRFLANHSLNIFVIYRIILAVLIIVLLR